MSKTVHKPTPEVVALRETWKRIRALIGGTEAMRAQGQTYLPKWPKEDQADYTLRLQLTTLFPAYANTIETLAAKPFSKSITRVDIGSEIEKLLEDIDMRGSNLDVFASKAFDAGLGLGTAGILVTYPKTEAVEATQAGVRTRAQEQQAGLRPYWVQIDAEQLLECRGERVAGKMAISLLRYEECVEEVDPVDEFVVKKVRQVRVLTPGSWRTYRPTDKDVEDWPLHAEGRTSLTYVPYVPVVLGPEAGYGFGKPSLDHLSHLNIKHWQSQSDQDNILHVARVPIIFMKGFQKGAELTVGASAAVRADPAAKDADMKFVEHTGQAIGAGKTSLDDLKEDMRQTGAELLVLRPGEVTATEVSTDNAVAMCKLQRYALAFQDALNLALVYTGNYIRDDKPGTVKLFTDFGAGSLDMASAQLVHNRNVAGKLSDESAHEELQRRGVISPDRDWDAEKVRIEADGEALAMMGGPVDPLADPLAPPVKPKPGQPRISNGNANA